MKAIAKSDKGRVRNQNEDYYYISENNDKLKLYMLADRYGTDMKVEK
ncbi:MAG: hypothetical protein HFJ54_05455 [Clostridia bacterium]|nr:hypothetical protein [Clostridia bacterium]